VLRPLASRARSRAARRLAGEELPALRGREIEELGCRFDAAAGGISFAKRPERGFDEGVHLVTDVHR
jgi:hypothetical protein